jgi:hypothetical protein
MFGFLGKIRKFFKKKSTGVAILETAVTLPIILYTIFFAIELVRIGLAQAAVDAITKEFTFHLMATGKVEKNKVDAIFNKYKPFGIDIGNFRYYIRIYSDITTMMNNSPYGGETIGWAGTDYSNPTAGKSPTDYASSVSYGLTTSHALLNKYQSDPQIVDGSKGEYGSSRKTLLEQTTGVPSGYIFVLTVAVRFPFSSPFVAKLFAGGKNTNRANVFILWARGSGMVN